MLTLPACGETRRNNGQDAAPRATPGAPRQSGGSGSQDVGGGAGSKASGAGGMAEGGQIASAGAPEVATGGASGGTGGASGGTGGASGGSAGVPAERDAMAARWPMPNPVGSGLPNPASYDTSIPGVVLDNVTGLIWQREVTPELHDWSSASQYCEELELGGHDDWRLPRRIELVSLIDYTRAAPAIDSEVFPDVPSQFFWSAGIAPRHAGIDFRVGNTGWLPLELAQAVRCVRASEQEDTAPLPFITTELSVLDQDTGLQWERDFSLGPLVSHDAAKLKCEALTLEGHADWRVPSMKELQTLVDERHEGPALDRAIFPTATVDTWWYETSTVAVSPSGISAEVWELRFADGVTQSAPAGVSGGVHCVR